MTLGQTSNVIMCLMGLVSVFVIAISGSAFIMIMLLYSQVLSFVFIRRLFRLNALAQRDTELIAAMTKMTLIALASTMGSVAVTFGLIICGLAEEVTPTIFIVIAIATISDVMLDAIFVSLSLPIHEKYYRFLCSGCDSRVRKCCGTLTDRRTRKKELELAAAQKDSMDTEQSVT